MDQTVDKHFLRRLRWYRYPKAAGIEMSSWEDGAEAVQAGQEWRSRHDLQGTPSNEQIGFEHHWLSAFPQRHPAAAAEQKAEIGTDQDATPGGANGIETDRTPAATHPSPERFGR